jgi:hypothetical protein
MNRVSKLGTKSSVGVIVCQVWVFGSKKAVWNKASWSETVSITVSS